MGAGTLNVGLMAKTRQKRIMMLSMIKNFQASEDGYVIQSCYTSDDLDVYTCSSSKCYMTREVDIYRIRMCHT